LINIVEKFRGKEMDGIEFFKNNGEYVVNLFDYKKKGEKVPGSSMGDFYHIILMPKKSDSEPEKIEAILTSPLHYVESLMNDNFNGVVAKVTTTSEEVMNKILKSVSDNSDKENQDDE
jgi:hypothetical protein